MSAARRRLQRLRGLGPLPARTFATPLVVAVLAVAYWWILTWFLGGNAGPLPHHFAYACGRRMGALSIADCGILLTLLLIANFGALLFGWLTDVRRSGWEGHRGWRLGLALFAALLVGLAMARSLDAILLPSDADLVDEAVAAFETGDCSYLLAALEYGVDGATDACRPYLDSDDLSERFFAAMALWCREGQRPEDARAACESMRALRRLSDAGGPPGGFSVAFRMRIWDGIAARHGWAYPLLTLPRGFDAGFWESWERIETEILYKSAGGNPTK
jgi:hypothetical protein